MTKNDAARTVVLTPQVRALIQAQLQRLEAFQRASGIITPYVFVHTSGLHRGERIQDFRRA
jgi:hypothetical protein